ncbi:MAG: TPR end-of-group domain-containing protein [Bacteroidales bacterium]
MPNKLSQFWQELKRRNVVRVITVYAGAAFVIIELINNITEPLRLPEWTPTLVIILLAIGFPVVIIFSWIYDIHPEDGIVKTEGAEREKSAENPKSSNGWKIASYISFVVIVGLIILNIVPGSKSDHRSRNLDKSIAIIPFQNDSPDRENEYIINGMMESILNNLAKIKDLSVVSRSSIEQFRDSSVFVPDVARFLNVSYILEGSVQKYGDRIRMFVQLIDRDDHHIWSEQYDRVIRTVEENLSLQSEIATLVANELQAVITPAEKEFINKKPTADPKAYELYQRGREEYWKYWNDPDNIKAYERSTEYLLEALEYDSTFAEVYTSLALNYFEKNYWEEYFLVDFMDSAFSLVNSALYYDNQQPDAYLIRGRILSEKDMPKSAGRDLKDAINLNPNSWRSYFEIGKLYFGINQVSGFENLQKAASLNYGLERPVILNTIARNLALAGFDRPAKLYFDQALALSSDSLTYYTSLAAMENWTGNYTVSIEYCQKALSIDPNYAPALDRMAYDYMFMGEYDQSYRYYTDLVKSRSGSELPDINDIHRVAYAYWKAGLKDEADSLFNLQEQYCLRMIELGRGHASGGAAYYDLAGVYAFRGEKELAMENLRIFSEKLIAGVWIVTLINDDPLFDTLRGDPEFQQIVSSIEAKYQAEHEKVKQWLEENDML